MANLFQKRKLALLLKKISNDSDFDIIAGVLKEIENLKLSIKPPTDVTPLYNQIEEMRKMIESLSFKTFEQTTALNMISDRLSEIKSQLNTKYEEGIKLTESVKSNSDILLEVLKKEIDSIQKDIKLHYQKKGGGSIPLQISLNGVVANYKWADINIINVGGTSANNDTTHKTDITIVGGGVTPNSYLLQESGFYLLQENGDKIIL